MTVIAANAERYPVSAQCEILGVARSTYYRLLSEPERTDEPDPIEPLVKAIFRDNEEEFGARRIKLALAEMGVRASRRRVRRAMRRLGISSSYARAGFKPAPSRPNDADVPNVVGRDFGGRRPHEVVASDLTYVRTGGRWSYVCLMVDLYNREIVGHSCGPRKTADLVKAAFATLEFPISDISVFHTDRGSEFANGEIDALLSEFGVERSLSAPGCPYDNSVVEATNRIFKGSRTFRRGFGDVDALRRGLNSWVWWYNNERIHMTLGGMSPVAFRKAGLFLEAGKKCPK